MTFSNLSIKKTIINWTELWYSWQETISNSSNLKIIKNICGRIFTTHHIYRSQEPASVYNNKAVESTTSLMIRVTNNNRANILSRRSNHIKIKKIFKHSILRVNNDESLSVNKHELNIMLRIIRDNKKEYSVV